MSKSNEGEEGVAWGWGGGTEAKKGREHEEEHLRKSAQI